MNNAPTLTITAIINKTTPLKVWKELCEYLAEHNQKRAQLSSPEQIKVLQKVQSKIHLSYFLVYPSPTYLPLCQYIFYIIFFVRYLQYFLLMARSIFIKISIFHAVWTSFNKEMGQSTMECNIHVTVRQRKIRCFSNFKAA